jgi:hypothetical protein
VGEKKRKGKKNIVTIPLGIDSSVADRREQRLEHSEHSRPALSLDCRYAKCCKRSDSRDWSATATIRGVVHAAVADPSAVPPVDAIDLLLEACEKALEKEVNR